MLLTTAERGAFHHLPAGVDHVDVRVERTRLLEMVWRGDRFESATRSTDRGCSARVHGPTGTSFAWATGTDVAATVRAAADGATLLRAPAVRRAAVQPLVGEIDCVVGERPEDVDAEEKAAILGGYHAAALTAHPLVAGALVYYRESLSDVEITSTDGAAVRLQRRDLTLQITVYADGGSDRPAGAVSVGSGGDFTVIRGLADRVEEAAAAAVDLVAAPSIGDDVLDVVCDGALAGAWAHETIGHLAEADHHIGDGGLQAALRTGRRLGPDCLTIADGPGAAGARGYVPVDDEGTTGATVPLLDAGIVATPRLHDRATAAAFGDPATGNGRTVGFRHLPLPRLRTLTIAPGSHPVDELVGGVRRGLLAEGYLGGQTDRQSFTFTPTSCRLITDGTIGRRVRGVVLSGDVLGAFGTIDAIGDVQWRGDTSAGCGKQGQYPLPVSAWSPALRLRGIRVRAG